MPNHMHGIIVIDNNKINNCRGGVTPPLQYKQRPTLGQIIAYFKYQSTKKINEIKNTLGLRQWQRNYYEHVIRNDESLNKIREYVMYNPLGWDTDIDNLGYINKLSTAEQTKQIKKHNDNLYT